MNQTTLTKQEAVVRSWFHADAKGKVLGPLAVRVALALAGRTKVDWTPNVDAGGFVVVTNVESLVVTGKKATSKIYKTHSGWMGGLNEVNFARMQAKHPERILELAVKRMLPKTVIGTHMLKRLKCYKGAAHPHVSQAPKPLP